jgi:DnaK suppressor protein
MTEDEIREKIDKEIKRTEEKIKDYSEMSKPVSPDDAIGRLSRMDAINNKSVAEAALHKAKEKLKKLGYAKTQIGKVGFGKCKRCGNPIPIGRIIIRPESLYCVSCAD